MASTTQSEHSLFSPISSCRAPNNHHRVRATGWLACTSVSLHVCYARYPFLATVFSVVLIVVLFQSHLVSLGNLDMSSREAFGSSMAIDAWLMPSCIFLSHAARGSQVRWLCKTNCFSTSCFGRTKLLSRSAFFCTL